MLKLSPKERDMLPSDVELTRKVDDVVPYHIEGFHEKDFVINFLKTRGITRPKIAEYMLARFSDVEMHVDNLSPISHATLVIMITGTKL